MGLSIHYSGRLKNPALLPELIAEVKDIAEVYEWKYHVFEQQFPEGRLTGNSHDGNLYGISFSPPECEAVWLCFLSNRRMSGPANLLFHDPDDTDSEDLNLYTLSVKTQFAGMGIHRIIIHLLRHLQEKYLADFELQDEGHHWETGDVELLRTTFARYTTFWIK